MLKTETRTADMRRRIERAALKKFAFRFGVFFEHGQWWLENGQTGAQWSVVDAEGPGAIDGFDFEQVTQGEEN
jgi:hypothetical protein